MSDQVSGQFSVDSSEKNGTLFTNDQQSVVSVTFTASGTWNTGSGSNIDYGPEGKIGAHNKNAAYPKSTLYALLAVNSNNEVVGEGATIKLALQPDESVRFVVNDTHYPNNSGQLAVDWQINATATRQLPAADNDEPSQAVEHPTWDNDIKKLFTDEDIEHMNSPDWRPDPSTRIDLSSYEDVKEHAQDIYESVESGFMPMGRDPWPQEDVETFKNWMDDCYPESVPSQTQTQVIEHPTWLGDIRYFFEDVDIKHMREFGIELATYAGVKAKAESIYVQTKPPRATMPLDPKRQWSQARSDTFYNWMCNDYPFGTPKVQVNLSSVDPRATRIRKDILTLSQGELDKLKRAFEGIMALDPKGPDDPVDPNSYFGQAAIHGRPLPFYCVHGEPKFLPWHRVYLQSFEDALRCVEGCEDVTLPYWDIAGPVPEVLYQPPFDKYTVPVDIGAPEGALNDDNSTLRNCLDEVQRKLEEAGIAEAIEIAGSQPVWQDFATCEGSLERAAHNPAHNLTGPTVEEPDVAAFDPIFWFFHADWDRLWWKWQLEMDATDLNGFLSTIDCSDPDPSRCEEESCPPTSWLTGDNHLLPFTDSSGIKADDTIDLVNQFCVDYAQPANVQPSIMLKRTRGSARAQKTVRLRDTLKASVRVKGVDRLNIPGSFFVHLRADGETIARRGFFQRRNPRTCGNCREKALVNFDFEVEVEKLRGRDISVAIELTHSHWISRWVPLSRAGDPTINARLLLHDE